MLKWIPKIELNNHSKWINEALKIVDLNTAVVLVGHTEDEYDSFCDKLGVCMPKALGKYYDASDEVWDVFDQFDSAYGISIRGDVRQGPEEYLAYVLGHEMGHILICEKEGIETHVLSCLVYSYTSQLQDGGNIRHNFEFPAERFCDLYGKALASSIFGESSFNRCLGNRIIEKKEKENKDDRDSEWLLEQPSAFPTFLVKDRTRNLFKPYRAELIKLWEQDREKQDSRDLQLVDWPMDFQKLI